VALITILAVILRVYEYISNQMYCAYNRGARPVVSYFSIIIYRSISTESAETTRLSTTNGPIGCVRGSRGYTGKRLIHVLIPRRPEPSRLSACREEFNSDKYRVAPPDNKSRTRKPSGRARVGP